MRFALDRKLWGHALVLASSLDKDAWREAVNELIRSDLAQPPPQEDDSNGRESLRVAYALFAGLSGAATYEFSPPWLSSQLRSTAPPTAVPSRSLTPAPAGATTVTGPSRAPTPASAFIAPPPSLSASTLSRWQETAATIVANRVAGDTQALGVLGDTLAANGWIDAAHCWCVRYVAHDVPIRFMILCAATSSPLLRLSSAASVKQAPRSCSSALTPTRRLLHFNSTRTPSRSPRSSSSLCRWRQRSKDKRPSLACHICRRSDSLKLLA